MDGLHELKVVDQCRYLGVILDKNLSWKPHVNHVIKKLSNVLRILYRIRHCLSKNALLSITHSLFLSHINYGILCWGRAGKTTLHPIKILLNKLIKCINFKTYRFSEVNTLFLDNKILQVDDIFNLELGKFLYKFSNNQLPVLFLTILQDYLKFMTTTKE